MVNVHAAGKKARHFEETMYFHEAALSGYTYRQIASLASSRFGRAIGHELVRKRLEKYRAERVVESRDELVGVEVARLDRYLAVLDKTIAAEDRVEELPLEGGRVQIIDSRPAKIAALTTALKVAERRSKLLGLDTPAQAEVTVTNVAPVDLEMEALAAEIAARRDGVSS